jgi:hypothetical protein
MEFAPPNPAIAVHLHWNGHFADGQNQSYAAMNSSSGR